MISHQDKLNIKAALRAHLKARPHESLRDAAKRRRGDVVAEAVMNANGLHEQEWACLKAAAALVPAADDA